MSMITGCVRFWECAGDQGSNLTDKCVVASSELVIFGEVISSEGVKPDPQNVDALKEFPPPQCKQDLLRFIGMVKYLGCFIPKLSECTTHMRELLQKGLIFIWTEAQQHRFDEVKSMLCSEQALQFYDPRLPIQVSADASTHGLGAILQQKHREEQKPVSYASRSTTDTESQYAPIERVFWPNIQKDIDDKVGWCSACLQYQPN